MDAIVIYVSEREGSEKLSKRKGKTKMFYSTKDEAIEREIITPIENGEATREEYDIDAIAEAVIDSDDRNRYYVREDVDFWDVVADNQI